MKIYLLRWEKQIILTVSWFYKLQISDKDTGTSICIFVPGPENFGPGLPVHSLPASSHFCGAPATYAGHFTLLSIILAASQPCLAQSLPFREYSYRKCSHA